MLLMCAGTYFAIFALLTMPLWLQILCAIVLGMALLAFIALNLLEKHAFYKTLFVIVVIAAVLVFIYYAFAELGLSELLSSADKLKAYIESTGAWGIIIFGVIQFAQVLVLPIPAMATTAAGVLVWGPLETAFVSFFAIVLGSIAAFYIGRIFGEKVVSWMLGPEKTKKYSNLLYEKGKYVFFLMMLFPLFPDDLLCMVAGMTAMRFRFFLGTLIVTRIASVFTSVYFTDFVAEAIAGKGPIPLEGWGLAVWITLGLLLVAAFVISIKYQKQIEGFFVKMGEKMGLKQRKAGEVEVANNTNKTEIEFGDVNNRTKKADIEPKKVVGIATNNENKNPNKEAPVGKAQTKTQKHTTSDKKVNNKSTQKSDKGAKNTFKEPNINAVQDKTDTNA